MTDIERLERWLAGVSQPGWVQLAKRLSANDTGATRAHQVGFYVPKPIAFAVDPSLERDESNPKAELSLYLASHEQTSTPVLTWYNNKLRSRRGTRDECRITRFGGRQSAFQDTENTGALLLIAFRPRGGECTAWLAKDLEEESILEGTLGPVLPGTILSPNVPLEEAAPCIVRIEDLPPRWMQEFPSGLELAREAASRSGQAERGVDLRIRRRLQCEYELFKVIEQHHVEPLIRQLGHIDEFISLANSVLNRRKSRAGRSLQNQLAIVFAEEAVAFEPQVTTEPSSIPDFIFPSKAAYEAAEDGCGIYMLAAKTTLKDRWRQVLDEARKLRSKHVFTLAEGVSERQFEAMKNAGLTLVVPEENLDKFPREVRGQLLTLREFIEMLRNPRAQPL